MPMLHPPHPGLFIRTEVIEPWKRMMRRQSAYDIACTRARANSIRVRPYEPRLSA